jgi:hypothetical protein
MLVHVTDSQIRSWRLRGFKLEHIARVCGTTISRISHRIQLIWQNDQQRAEYFGDPDEQTIRQRCVEIQASWSDRERLKREVGRGGRWRATVVPASILAHAQD